MDNKYEKMNKEQVLLELATALKKLEDAEKETDSLRQINSRLNYKINILKNTISTLVSNI